MLLRPRTEVIQKTRKKFPNGLFKTVYNTAQYSPSAQTGCSWWSGVLQTVVPVAQCREHTAIRVTTIRQLEDDCMFHD